MALDAAATVEVPSSPAAMNDNDDDMCCVCGDGVAEDGNAIVFCDGCDIAVHQACYGIDHVPADSWYCDACGAGAEPRCRICNQPDGALKPCATSAGGGWCHVTCAMWIPELTFGDPEALAPVQDFHKIHPSRQRLKCAVCQNTGACIQCTLGKCTTAFHPECGRKIGLLMEIQNGPEDLVTMVSLCRMHSRVALRKRGQQRPQSKPRRVERSGGQAMQTPSPQKASARVCPSPAAPSPRLLSAHKNRSCRQLEHSLPSATTQQKDRVLPPPMTLPVAANATKAPRSAVPEASAAPAPRPGVAGAAAAAAARRANMARTLHHTLTVHNPMEFWQAIDTHWFTRPSRQCLKRWKQQHVDVDENLLAVPDVPSEAMAKPWRLSPFHPDQTVIALAAVSGDPQEQDCNMCLETILGVDSATPSDGDEGGDGECPERLPEDAEDAEDDGDAGEAMAVVSETEEEEKTMTIRHVLTELAQSGYTPADTSGAVVDVNINLDIDSAEAAVDSAESQMESALWLRFALDNAAMDDTGDPIPSALQQAQKELLELHRQNRERLEALYSTVETKLAQETSEEAQRAAEARAREWSDVEAKYKAYKIQCRERANKERIRRLQLQRQEREKKKAEAVWRRTFPAGAAEQADAEDEEKEVICAICGDGDVEDDNQIVMCDCCDTAVHQQCYGVPVIPPGDDPYFCRRCELMAFDEACAVCLQYTGAMLPALDGKGKQKWCHVVCALYVPALWMNEPPVLEPIQGLSKVDRARSTLTCSLCKEKGGACIQCDSDKCTKAFHPQCARECGMEMTVTADSASANAVRFVAHCMRHRQNPPRYSLASYAQKYEPIRERVPGVRAEMERRRVEKRKRRREQREAAAQELIRPAGQTGGAAASDKDHRKLKKFKKASQLSQHDDDDRKYGDDLEPFSGNHLGSERARSFFAARSATIKDSSRVKAVSAVGSAPLRHCDLCLRRVSCVTAAAAQSQGAAAPEQDMLLHCTSCGCTAHPECYGVAMSRVDQIVSAMSGDVALAFGKGKSSSQTGVCNWFCDHCVMLAYMEPGSNPHLFDSGLTLTARAAPSCCVCHVNKKPLNSHVRLSSAFKPTREGGWAHAVCAAALPELNFRHCSDSHIQYVCGMHTLHPLRRRLRCSLCGKCNGGACVQCAHPHCQEAFHPSCAHAAARTHQMRMIMAPVEQSGGDSTLETFFMCPTHASLKFMPPLSGQGLKEQPVSKCEICTQTINQRSYDDPVLECSSCSVAVHSLCYGAGVRPAGGSEWLCEPCAAAKAGAEASPAQCCLCPVPGGALKPAIVASGVNGWAHVLCAQYVPQVYFAQPQQGAGQVLLGIKEAIDENGGQKCHICKSFGGGVLKCQTALCKTFFHASCARKQGWLLRELDTPEDGKLFVGLCQRHARHNSSSSACKALMPTAEEDANLRQVGASISQGLQQKLIVSAESLSAGVDKSKPKLAAEELFCYCRSPYQEGEFMIGCERCDQWYHGWCVGATPEETKDTTEYLCPSCAPLEAYVGQWPLPFKGAPADADAFASAAAVASTTAAAAAVDVTSERVSDVAKTLAETSPARSSVVAASDSDKATAAPRRKQQSPGVVSRQSEQKVEADSTTEMAVEQCSGKPADSLPQTKAPAPPRKQSTLLAFFRRR